MYVKITIFKVFQQRKGFGIGILCTSMASPCNRQASFTHRLVVFAFILQGYLVLAIYEPYLWPLPQRVSFYFGSDCFFRIGSCFLSNYVKLRNFFNSVSSRGRHVMLCFELIKNRHIAVSYSAEVFATQETFL